MIFFLYIEITNNYYQKQKEKLQKRSVKDIKIFLNEKKTKSKKSPRKI